MEEKAVEEPFKMLVVYYEDIVEMDRKRIFRRENKSNSSDKYWKMTTSARAANLYTCCS
jgi:hypothetical protein